MARRGDELGADQVWTADGRRPAGENGRALRTLALVAVVLGLVALTTAACVLSYSSVHDFALRAGISPSLARIYPDICDAMLVIAGCSVLVLRGAGLLSRMYGWLCFIVLLGALAASSVVHEAGVKVPLRAAEITAAVFPWALVLVAFGLLLALLRHARRRRQTQRTSPATGDALRATRSAAESPALLQGTSYDPAKPAEAVMASGPMASPEEPGEPSGYDVAPGFSEPDIAESGVVSPTVPLPRASVEPDDAPQPPKAVIRPTEMQLRARASRQPAEPQAAEAQAGEAQAGEAQAADQPVGDQPTGELTPPAGAPVVEPPTSGFTGDTIPHGELNPAPTPDQPGASPPKLDRPHSSPTPPS